ncbi:hypothetical protein N7507_005009, partial [Penicillium longicatenatum]
IYALLLEIAAIKLILDTIHLSLPSPPTDYNIYIFRNIGEYNVVIAYLLGGVYSIILAIIVAMYLLSSFYSIRFGLIVGISGGILSNNVDIRLGDIISILADRDVKPAPEGSTNRSRYTISASPYGR